MNVIRSSVAPRVGRSVLLTLIVTSMCAFSMSCVSSKKFSSGMSDVTGRVDGIQSTVEQQGENIEELGKRDQELASDIGTVRAEVGEVRTEAGEAMSQAQMAQAMANEARGKVIWQVTLSNRDVQFGLDKAALTDSGRGALNDLVSVLRGYDKMVFVEIQGHTDSTGNETYNHQLGMKRAEAVRAYLHEQGIPLNLMSVISYGETRPVADNKTREGRTMNRRVEVLVLE